MISWLRYTQLISGFSRPYLSYSNCVLTLKRTGCWTKSRCHLACDENPMLGQNPYMFTLLAEVHRQQRAGGDGEASARRKSLRRQVRRFRPSLVRVPGPEGQLRRLPAAEGQGSVPFQCHQHYLHRTGNGTKVLVKEQLKYWGGDNKLHFIVIFLFPSSFLLFRQLFDVTMHSQPY